MKKKIVAILCLSLACIFAFAGCGYSRHRVKNKNTLETEVFLDKPENMVVICNGKENKLTEAASDEVYESFMTLMEHYSEFAIPLCGYDSSIARNRYVNECKKKWACVEFRYDRRRKYTGKLSSESFRYDCEYFTNRKFDAILLVCEKEWLTVLPYYENKYSFSSPCHLIFERGAMGEFTSLLESYSK